MKRKRENSSCWRKIFSCDNLSATNPTWNSPRSNPGLRGD